MTPFRLLPVLLIGLLGIYASACSESSSRGGEGEYCRDYCSPACVEGAFCDNGTCTNLKPCNPACDATTEYCDHRAGFCRSISEPPATQSPCNDGLVCVNGVCQTKSDEPADGDEPNDGDDHR